MDDSQKSKQHGTRRPSRSFDSSNENDENKEKIQKKRDEKPSGHIAKRIESGVRLFSISRQRGHPSTNEPKPAAEAAAATTSQYIIYLFIYKHIGRAL